jgi:chromosome segregation ATPase
MQICVEGPTGIKLRECADKVIGLKQEMTVLKQNVKSQANTQDSLRAAVSVLDKQVQVLPSTLAKQLAQPAEQQDTLPKSKSEATELLQKRQTQGSDVTEKQLAQWSEVLDEQPEAESVLAARAAFMRQQQQQQQSVPLSRQLIEEPQKQLPSAIPAPVGPSPNAAEEQQAAGPKAQAAGPTAAPEPVVQPVTVVQV